MTPGRDLSLTRPPFRDDRDGLWVAEDLESGGRGAIAAAVEEDRHLRREIEHLLRPLSVELRIAFLGALGRALRAAPDANPAAAVRPALEHVIGVALSSTPTLPRPS